MEMSPQLHPRHSFINVSWNAPKIRLVLKQCPRTAFSPTFSKFHYMDASINCTAKCWSVWAYFSSFDPLATGNQSNNKKKRSDKEENDVDDEEDDSMSVDNDEDAYY